MANEMAEGNVKETADLEGGKGVIVIEEDEEPLPSSKWRLVLLMTCALLFPAVLLFVTSYLDKDVCTEAQGSCMQECADTYLELVRRFASELQREVDCQSECQADFDQCTAEADALVIGALLLAVGLCSSVCLLYALDTILRRSGSDGTPGPERPRAAYMEPVFTEEEQRSMARAKADSRRKKKPVEGIELTEAHCRECDVKIQVELRWESGLRGGLSGATCPRCKRVIVGLL